jgi:hypothetical protein
VVEEPARDRHQPLVPTLALGDEHPPRRHPQVVKPQAKSWLRRAFGNEFLNSTG